MKKIFTICAVAMLSVATFGQTKAFAGADFENWSEFQSGVNSYGIKDYATQGVGLGYNNTNSLHIEGTPSANDYVFTSFAPADAPQAITDITFLVKGTSAKSLSINLYNATSYYKFNVGDLGSTDATIEATASNQYAGTINTEGQWVKVTLDLAGISDLNTATTDNFFALKVGKDAAYNLDIDNVMINGSLAVATVNAGKASLVKNTSVADVLVFAKAADVKIFNLNGQLVKEAKVDANTSLDLSALPKGVYLVNGAGVSQKIIKK